MPSGTQSFSGGKAFDGGKAASTGRAGTRRAGKDGPPRGILGLQRTAGNRAVSGLVGDRPSPVQRIVPMTPSAMDKVDGTFGAIKGLFGPNEKSMPDGPKKDFAAIRRALAEYRSAAKQGDQTRDLQAQRLVVLDALCAKFIAAHRADRKRWTMIDRLSDQVGSERAKLSQAQGQDIYQANVRSGRQPVAPDEADPGKKFGFQALSSFGKRGALDHSLVMPNEGDRGARLEAKQAKYGLTDAEISAITIFSAGDFNYINPSTSNSDSRLESSTKDDPELARVGKRTIKEEGSLHTAVALQGLGKMEPYEGETYRGARYTPEDFQEKFKLGATTSFTSLASSSADKNVALNFAHGLGSGGAPGPEISVAVLSVLTNSGGVDISDIALVKSEAEVLIRPGSVFEVVSVQEVDGNVEYADKVAEAAAKKRNLPTKWYVCTLAPTNKKPESKPPAPKPAAWKSATPSPPEEGRPESFDLKPLVRNGRGLW